MADLHNKLALRRKGISGTKDTAEKNPPQTFNVLDCLLTRIPPPPMPQANSSTNETSDDDWE